MLVLEWSGGYSILYKRQQVLGFKNPTLVILIQNYLFDRFRACKSPFFWFCSVSNLTIKQFSNSILVFHKSLNHRRSSTIDLQQINTRSQRFNVQLKILITAFALEVLLTNCLSFGVKQSNRN